MSAADTSLPLRSLLFAPGNEPRKVQKVATFGSDAIILDLEDAVPDADKVATRPLVRAVLADLATVGPLVFVRVNSLATGLTAVLDTTGLSLEWWITIAVVAVITLNVAQIATVLLRRLLATQARRDQFT